MKAFVVSRNLKLGIREVEGTVLSGGSLGVGLSTGPIISAFAEVVYSGFWFEQRKDAVMRLEELRLLEIFKLKKKLKWLEELKF